jgi:hypothetical protein
MDYILSNSEFWAVKDFVDAHMDELDPEVKSGLLKLLNGESLRQSQTSQPH